LQRFGGGQLADGDPLPVAAAGAGIADPGAEPVQVGLRAHHRVLVGQSAPPALRRAVVGLLDHP
jgi:hypothetical protein